MPASRYAIFFSIALVGCAVDLATKSYSFATLGRYGERVYWLVEGLFGFRTTLNEGALFGIGQGGSLWFAGLSVVAGVFISYWLFVARAARDRLLTVALGCVMAGILGNLYDRLGLHGLTWEFPVDRIGEPALAVRDFIHFTVGTFEWPTFNIADTLLVCGAGMLLLHSLKHDQQKAQAG